jgi:hypothetical protein
MLLSPKNPFQLTSPAAPTLYAHGKVAVIADLATSAALLAMGGAIILVVQLASARRWGWMLCLALVPPLLVVQTSSVALEVARLTVPLLRQIMDANGASGLFRYAAISIGPLCPVLIYGCASSMRRQSSILVGMLGLLLAVYLLQLANPSLEVGWAGWLVGLAAWVVAVGSAVAERRWTWLVGMLLLLALSVVFTLPGLGPLTAALTYGLWGGQKGTK